jgi:F-type H+-transporting ATPase subunit epsilon
MDNVILLRVLTDAGLAIEDQAVSVIAPGELGYLGILKNHAPLVTTLSPGKLTWRRPSGVTNTARVGTGLLEILHNRLTILTDTFSMPERETPPARTVGT